MEERPLSEKESLELITRMIKNTHQKLEEGNGIPFLVWGYTSVIVSLFVMVYVNQYSGLSLEFPVVSDTPDRISRSDVSAKKKRKGNKNVSGKNY